MAKILVVDDEPTLRNVLQYNLTKETHQVRTAGDGEEAIDQAREYEPDLILLDVMLPKLDGFEVCKAIRRESNVPILMLTAKDSEIDKVVGTGDRCRRLHNQAVQHARVGGEGEGDDPTVRDVEGRA